MSTPREHLQKENQAIRLGVDLLSVYLRDLQEGRSVSSMDLRMAVYALQNALEKCHFLKEEMILFPALRSARRWSSLPQDRASALDSSSADHEAGKNSLLELRFGVEEYERSQRHGLLAWCLDDCLGRLNRLLEREEHDVFPIADEIFDASERNLLAKRLLAFDTDSGDVGMRGARLIFERLRNARGLPAA